MTSKRCRHDHRASRPTPGVVGPGDLFVALNTGVEHVADAAARGASTLVPDDQEAALAALASLVRSKSDARVVAVVGSTGKTSTKDILGALCSAAAPTIWAEASLNNEIGLPLTVCRLEPETAGARHRDGHARARADRRALCDRAARPRSSSPRSAPSTSSSSAPSRASLRRTPRRSPLSRPVASPSCRPTRRARAPSRPRRHRDPPVRPGRGRREAVTSGGSRSGDREIALTPPVHLAAHGGEHARGARRLRRARAAARTGPGGRRSDRAVALARGGATAAGRRHRRQRRLQREPGLDAGRAPRSRRARGRAPPGRDPRRDGRARRQLEALPRRDRRAPARSSGSSS